MGPEKFRTAGRLFKTILRSILRSALGRAASVARRRKRYDRKQRLCERLPGRKTDLGHPLIYILILKRPKNYRIDAQLFPVFCEYRAFAEKVAKLFKDFGFL